MKQPGYNKPKSPEHQARKMVLAALRIAYWERRAKAKSPDVYDFGRKYSGEKLREIRAVKGV